MYIYQDGKVYVQEGNDIVGVEIHPDSLIKLEKTRKKLGDGFEILTPFEVYAKFQISTENPYLFPVEEVETEVEEIKLDEEVEVVKNEPVIENEKPTRKYNKRK